MCINSKWYIEDINSKSQGNLFYLMYIRQTKPQFGTHRKEYQKAELFSNKINSVCTILQSDWS